MTPQRGQRAAELGRVRKDLGERDWAVLRDIGRLRLLTGRHVERLRFQEGSPLTRARRSRSTLQRLFDMGLLVRLERRVGGVHAGSAGFTYGLSTTGQRLVTGCGPAGGQRLRRPWEPSANFVDHLLLVSELYVSLVEEARKHEGVELLDFRAEPAAWRYWHGPSGERLVLKPDAFVATADERAERLSFVEADRSTESLKVIRRKAQAYVDYWRSGDEQSREGVFPVVLFVVPDEHRKAGVVGELARLDPEIWRLFQVVVGTRAAASALIGRPPPEAAVEDGRRVG